MILLQNRASLMMNICCFGRNLFTASPILPPVQPPSQMEAHFWYASPDEVKSTSLLNQYLEILSPCEKENIVRMSGEQLRKRALLARALVRTTLARYQTDHQIDPKSLRFRKNNYGKPEIGIDVEEKQRRLKNDILAFARRYFSPHELEVLTNIANPEIQRLEFIKLWTLKEAYVKALGTGFSASPFKTFTVRLRDQVKEDTRLPPHMIYEVPEITVESSDDPKSLLGNWQFSLLELGTSHYAAICMKHDKIREGSGSNPIKLTLRKTIPFVKDECVYESDAAVIGGLTTLLVSNSVVKD